MAKIKFGMMMTDARGKLGGQVFSKNRSGAYVRTKVTPVNPRTTFQQANRSLFGSISSVWRSLTDPQRASWDENVEMWQTTDIFGDIKKPSGKTLFQRLNQGLLSNVVGSFPLVTAPAPVEIHIVSDVSSELTIGDTSSWSVMWSHEVIGAVSADNYVVQVRATMPMSPGRTYHKNLLRNIASGNLEDDTFDLLADYLARFGRLPNSNEKVYVEIRVVSRLTGQIGVPYSALTSVILAAPDITAFSVTPTSGSAPYLYTASFENAQNIDFVNYGLEFRSGTSSDACPTGVQSGSSAMSAAVQLVTTGEFSTPNSVPSGSCRTVSLILRDLTSGDIITSMNVQIDNL